MDLPAPALRSYAAPRFTWRTAALLAGALAAVELIALVVVALAFVAKPFADDAAGPAKPKAAAAAAKPEKDGGAAAGRATEPVPAAKLSRTKTGVIVLNGNGISGAASDAAERVRILRYPIAGVADATRHDFPRTIVMYRPGFEGEAERLARDLGLGPGRAVALDGMRPADLGGAKVALIVGG